MEVAIINEKVTRLETELRMDIEGIKSDLKKLINLVDKMNVGLYGDEENNHVGVIDRQKYLEKRIDSLVQRIEEIEKKNVEQDVSILAKKQVNNSWMEWGKVILQAVINVIVILAVLKGLIGADALLK